MDTTFERTPSMPRIRLSLETIVYIFILAVALGLRVVALGDTPLDNAQAHEALAALRRVNDDVPGGPLTAHYPLMAFVNQLMFLFFGTSSFVARLATALAGTAVVFGPLLWRSTLGRIPALVMSGLLALSPVAITASRTMGGVTWSILIVFIAGWALLRFWETQQPRYATMVMLSVGSLILLTTPTGILTFGGLLIGLMFAVSALPRDSEGRQLIRESNRHWNWTEGLMAILVAVLVIGTGFFTISGGLTSVGSTLAELIDGFGSRPDGQPLAYAFLVAVRYEFGILLFGLVGVYLALTNDSFVDRFFAGWLMWSALISLIYVNATPDMALWLTVPAAGLTAIIISELLTPAHSGYWSDLIPGWGIPFHAVITTTILVAIALNLLILGRATQTEAEALSIERIEFTHVNSAAKLGALAPGIPQTTMQLDVPAVGSDPKILERYQITLQIERIDDGWTPTLTVTNNQDDTVLGPFIYDEEDGLIEPFILQNGVSYFFRIGNNDGPLSETRQFMLLTYEGSKDDVSGLKLSNPTIMTLLRISPKPLRSAPFLFVPFLTLLAAVIYMLMGSLWGPRAALRGAAFGVLIYFVGAGLGLGLQASYTFADDPRELWHTSPVDTDGYESLAETLRFMSLQATGEPDKMTVTVQGEDDGALAWLLRNFENARFVSQTNPEITSDAVIVPFTNARPALGDDYVGQDFTLSQDWPLSDLSWTDFVAWLTVRQTRIAPVADEEIMLWVRKDVYGVKEIPTAPSE